MRCAAVSFAAVPAMLLALACGGSEKEAEEPGVSDEDRISLGDRPDSRRSGGPGTDDDDDDDDGMEVEGLKGHLAPYDIQRGVQKHSAALSSCYHDKLGKRRYVGGGIEMMFIVKRDGTVKSVHMGKSDLGEWSMEKCLLGAAANIKFKKPKGGEAEFTVPLEFTPRKPALWWGDDRTTTEVAEKLPELAACKEAGAAPKKTWITAYVGIRGQVQSVGFAVPEGGMTDEWATCAEGVVKAWELGDPLGKIVKLSFLYTES